MSITSTLAAPLALVELTQDAARGAVTPATGPDLTRYVLVCAGLLLAIVGVAWLMRRVLSGAMKRRAAARSLQIMDVLPLGGKQRLAVVRCYDRTFLLGLGEKELTAISELDAVIAPARAPEPSRADLHAFGGVLERATPAAAGRAVARSLEREGVLG